MEETEGDSEEDPEEDSEAEEDLAVDSEEAKQATEEVSASIATKADVDSRHDGRRSVLSARRKAARAQFFSACYFADTQLPADFSVYLAEYEGIKHAN